MKFAALVLVMLALGMLVTGCTKAQPPTQPASPTPATPPAATAEETTVIDNAVPEENSDVTLGELV